MEIKCSLRQLVFDRVIGESLKKDISDFVENIELNGDVMVFSVYLGTTHREYVFDNIYSRDLEQFEDFMYRCLGIAELVEEGVF